MKSELNFRYRLLLILSIFSSLSVSGVAFAEVSQYEIDANAAQTYADAYAVRDVAALSTLIAEEAVFSDPSNRYEGKQAIVDGLTATFDKIISTGPESREISKFRSGNDFVFTAFADFNMLMIVGEQPESEFNFKVDFAMILTVKNGMVVRHTDYVDTNAFVAQLQAQLKED